MADYQNPFQGNANEDASEDSAPATPEGAGLMLRIGAFAADVFVIMALVLTVSNFFILRQDPDAAQQLEQYSEEIREYQEQVREANGDEEEFGPPPELTDEAKQLIQKTYIASLLMLLLYFVVGELLTKGASPGKLLFKLKVIRTDPGQPAVAASATVLRSVIKAVTLALAVTHPLLLIFLFNYFFAFLTQDRRAGHDFIARTKVVVKPSNFPHGSAPGQNTPD